MVGETFVVVGGDAAGMSAAGKAARDDPEMDVVVLERGQWVAYGACGLPYYVKGEIPALEDLLVRSPERLVAEYGIDLRRGHAAVGLDPGERAVLVAGPDGRYEQPYDHLLLATGGRAVRPDVPGADLEGVFAVRDLEAGRALREFLVPGGSDGPRDDSSADSTAVTEQSGNDTPTAGLHQHLRETDPESVAVVGANKIGLEMVEAFVGLDLAVHVVEAGAHVFERGPRTLPPFGTEAADLVEAHLREQGVRLHLGADVERFEGRDGRVTALHAGGERLPVDAVLVDRGVAPNVDLAVDADVAVGPTGAVATDGYGRTSAADVYAAGDCAEKRHAVTGEAVHLPLALPANRAGRAVGRTVAGRPTPVGEVLGTTVSKVFDLELACTGLLAPAAAREAGFDPVSETVTTISRAHYYPGWKRIAVEMTADRATGRLLGAGLAGEEGAAHRVDAAATAIHAGMTVADVGMLDYGYAPPFGPVWDPLLVGAKVLAGEFE